MIGTSNPSFDGDVQRFLENNYGKHTRILDVGAGAGKYRKMLPDYPMDALEANPECISKFDLESLYDHVFEGDMVEFKDYGNYDLVIMGDVLEHIPLDAAQPLVERIRKEGVDLFVKVPLQAPRGPMHGNHFEAHPQGDITVENFLERYKGSYYLFGDTTKGEKRSYGGLRVTAFLITAL